MMDIFQNGADSRFKVTRMLFLLNLVFAVAELMNDFQEFRADDDTVKFNHLVLRIDNNEETIFIGGVNRLYQLTSDLTLIGNITTGPVMDSPECTINHCPIYIQKKLTNNYNKVLVIDKEASKLIACGNVFQGLCSLYDIGNMTNSRKVYQPVAATDADSSTVAFLGMRLQLKGSRREVLYVGVTRHSSDHEILPTITSRDLDTNNSLNLIKNITLQQRDYLVNYVSGFNLGSFNYFLTTRRKSIDSSAPYVSKLVRICSEDVNFNSYAQIPIKCSKKDGEQYDLVQATFISKPAEELATSLGIQTSDDVLFAVFAQNKSNKLIKEESDEPNEHSALCIYSLKAVNEKFTENIKNCHQGKGYLASEFSPLNQKCTRTRTVINDEFCGSIENTPIDGEISLLASPVITFDRTLLTSIAVNLVKGQNVVYVGTNTGRLKKILLKSISNVSEMSDILIDEGFPVNSDMLFDSERNFLYVMTKRKLTKLNLYDCSEFKSCMDCLNAKSSFCGWCYTRNECCSQRRCNTSTSISNVPSWIQITGGCILVSGITPTETLIKTKTDVQFNFENLPRLGASTFICVFSFDDAESRSTDAVERNYNVMTCKTPDVSSLPKIPPGHQYITADLVLKTTTNFILARTNFFFFDCSLYTSCTACISRSSCNWCLNEHRCIYNKKENCIDGTVILNDQMSYCPRIKAVNNESEIIIPNLTKRNISVHFYTILQTFKENQFSCQFNVGGKLINKNAFLHNDVSEIECETMEFKYEKNTPNITVEFAVLWNNSIPLDNLDNIHIVLFKCNKMANDCVECLTMKTNHQCGWCKNDMNECTIKNQCHSKKSHWFGRTEICPDPVISRFWPKQGPLEGNTYITIQGENLGQRFEDLDNNITVANISCKPYKDLYKPAKQIVCLIRNRLVEAEPVEGPVFIRVGNYSATSNDFFKFVNPEVEDISPKRAPQSGGTELTIRGKNLNAGSRLEVFINGSLLCKVSSNTSSEMKCSISKSSKGPFKGSIAVKFDETLRYYEKDQFEYTEDPTIISIDGGKSEIKGPKSIPLGGATIFIDGTNFLSIQNPRFYIFDNSTTSNYSTCNILNDTRMTCVSPHFQQVNSSLIDKSNPKVLGYGFKTDNVPALEHISSNTSYLRLLLYPNPTFKSCSIGNYLTIDGDNINFAFRINDVTVQIDNDSCTVTSLSETQIICRPPSSQIEKYKENGDRDPPKVIIFMGANLRQTLENLSYPPNHQSFSWKVIIIVCLICAIVLILVVVFFLRFYKKKSTESSQALEKVHKEMDMLEMRVATESRKAFAELQTEMNDFTSNITSSIPFWDYDVYVMKVSFANIQDECILNRISEFENNEEVKRQEFFFNKIILNKTFLLLFIRTLEKDENFSMNDRVRVASLIMITLQNHMEYCTDIIKILLAELIEKYIQGGRHPKLLLRQTESVVEKMLTCWFTFLLYKFLKERVGEPLYVLFRAIKQQVDKGPVDAITSQAKYCLREEILIRQDINYKSMTIYVSIPSHSLITTGLQSAVNCVPVKVLDCDTISQVKEKAIDVIYRTLGYSQRPKPMEMNIEWIHRRNTRIILHDYDETSIIEGNWKRRNSLGSYKVPNGAEMNLISVNVTPYYTTPTSPETLSSFMFSTPFEWSNSSSMLTDVKPLDEVKYYNSNKLEKNQESSSSSSSMKETYKEWHLIKPPDEDSKHEDRNKMLPEIYFPRLLSTKGTLQKFVDDLFQGIFNTDDNPEDSFAIAIKYMFDFLDDQALQHSVDSEVTHIWKNNCLPLRFWVNLIKNPNFLFDEYKSNVVDSCLSVIAQTFMDSCSISRGLLTKDSPSSKLLYAKDIPRYQNLVQNYYSFIKNMPSVSDQDMAAMFTELRQHATPFNSNAALDELYKYVERFNLQLMNSLEEDEFAIKHNLVNKLKEVNKTDFTTKL